MRDTRKLTNEMLLASADKFSGSASEFAAAFHAAVAVAPHREPDRWAVFNGQIKLAEYATESDAVNSVHPSEPWDIRAVYHSEPL